MTKRSGVFIGVILGLAIGLGAVGIAVWTIFYNHIMESSEVVHIDVHEIAGTHPLQLNIAVQCLDSALVVRTVSIRRREQSVAVFYHLAVSGLVKPSLYDSEPYRLTVSDSVQEVRFGPNSEVIWRRTTPER